MLEDLKELAFIAAMWKKYRDRTTVGRGGKIDLQRLIHYQNRLDTCIAQSEQHIRQIAKERDEQRRFGLVPNTSNEGALPPPEPYQQSATAAAMPDGDTTEQNGSPIGADLAQPQAKSGRKKASTPKS